MKMIGKATLCLSLYHIDMYQINGNVLVFTDQHFGVKGNSQLRQKIGAMAIKNMLDAIAKHGIKNVVFCGDYFHQRNALTVDTLNIAHRCLKALSSKCDVYMILGNHDLFNKNSTDVNSINIFRDNEHVHVVDSAAEAIVNGENVLFVPWLSDLSAFKKNQFKMLFGHFDISSKFLIASYVQEHSRMVSASNEASNAILQDSVLDSSGNSLGAAEKHLGSFIELVEENGTIFAGHIHQHKEMRAKNRNFIFVGSPYQQNLGDIGCKCGYYVINSSNKYKFYECEGLPKHMQFYCSKILNAGIDSYDFSEAKGNIVQKVYDIDVSLADDVKISQKISSFSPYEELLPEYKVALDLNSSEDSSSKHFVEMLKKSKLDYINSYISQLDDKALDGIDRKKLFDVMEKYYKAISND